jgi:hypothetical protein
MPKKTSNAAGNKNLVQLLVIARSASDEAIQLPRFPGRGLLRLRSQ